MIQQNPMTIQGEYVSPVDGQITYTSSSTLTASGFPFTVDTSNCYIVSIRILNASNIWTTYVNGYFGNNITALNDLITINGLSPFLATDLQYVVIIKYQQKSYDLASDSTKVIITGQDHGSKTIDAVPIISAAQTVTASWVDLGASFEIPTAGYNTMGIWFKMTVQNSTGVQIQALAKHTPEGTEEYSFPIESVSSSLIEISPELIQFPNSNGLYLIKLKLDNIIPYIQLQIKATAVGATAATIDTLYYSLGY